MTAVPPLLTTLLEPVTALIPLTCIPDNVITSKAFVPLPLIVTVIFVAFVSEVVTEEILFEAAKLALPEDVNSKLGGAESTIVPNEDILPL